MTMPLQHLTRFFRLLGPVLLLLVVAIAASSPAVAPAANRNSGLVFVPGASGSGRHIAQPVDWLTWCGDCVNTDYSSTSPAVTNPTTCMWDTDDWFEYTSSGSSLAAGASTSISDCSYESTSSGDPNVSQNSVIHAAYLDITAPSPNLQVKETYSWTGGSHTFAPSAVWNPSTKRYDYRACMLITGVANGTWEQVPGSNGGWGVPVTITAAVANPSSRAVSNVGGVIQYGWLDFYAGGCQVPSPMPAPLQ